MARIAIIGAGVMGLAAAYHLVRAGHQVTVYEQGAEAGGMAAHMDLGGLSIERFYHFICKDDQPTFDLLAELGLADRLRWVGTSMGYHIGGALHPWGDPVSLLRFPALGPIEKLRYGLAMFLAVKRRDGRALDRISARDWLIAWCGRGVYEKLWRPLLCYKFYQDEGRISAAWLWTRIRRVGRSRRSLFQEELGYIEGGSETLVQALVRAIKAGGGTVRLGASVERVAVERQGGSAGRVIGLVVGGRLEPADQVISTVPMPLIPELVPDLPPASLTRYRAIQSIGVVCLCLRLKRSVSPHFWVNLNLPGVEIPGLIEFSNLRPIGGDSIVYVPYYMPPDHPKWVWSNQHFIDEAMATLSQVNPAIAPDDLIEARVGRLRHAQPVCPVGFADQLPPVQTPIAGLQIADTSFYYPEDRGIAESVRLARRMAAAVGPAVEPATGVLASSVPG